MTIGICSPINPASLGDFFDTEALPNINRGASSVNTYVKELLRNGHYVIVFTSNVPSTETTDYVLKGHNIEIHIIHSNPGIFITHALSRFYMVRRLRKYIQQHINRLDVLHAQWTYDFALAAKSFENRIPVFCSVRDWSPYIITVQSGLKKLQWRLYNVLTSLVMQSENIHFIANSAYTRGQILSAYPQKEVHTIFNPIDKDYIVKEKISYTKEPSFISIATSATEKRKNIDTLIKAFSIFHHKYRRATLRLVGGGFTDNNDLMKEYASKGLLEGVILCGFKNHKDLIQEIDKVNCLVHPSLEETFGNILIEGMARGAIVIGGEKAGAVPQVLGNGEYGILCDVTDVNSLVAAMEKSLNIDFSKNLSEKALKYTMESFGSFAVMEKHIRLYEKYLKLNYNGNE